MKVGDIVRVLDDELGTPSAPGWAAGEIAVILKLVGPLPIRGGYAAADIMVLGKVVQYNLTELEAV